MGFLLRISSVFGFALRRVIAQRGLAIATTLGLVTSIGLVMSVPLYTDAIYYSILQDELSNVEDQNVVLKRPAFTFMFRYVGSVYGLKEWDDITQVNTYLTGPAVDTLRLGHKQTVRYVKTDHFRLFPLDQVAYADVRDPLAWVNYAFISDFDQHATLVDGTFPTVATANPDDPLEVVVSRALADLIGIRAGEEFMTFQQVDSGDGGRNVQIPIRVTGIWQPKDPAEGYWFYRQSVFDTQLIIPEASFQGRIVPLVNKEIAQSLWYIIMDGSDIHADDVGWLVGSIEQVQQQAATLLANTRLENSPYEALNRYRVSSRLLNVMLYAFSIPIIGLLIAFIGLVVGLAVARQRNEIAVLRSRGATALQILTIAIIEATLLGLVAFAIGIPVSEQIAQAIGATKSFLNFTVDSKLRVAITSTTLQYGLAALGVTLAAQIIPSIGAARHTIISYKQEQARTVRSPWWQRAWLDVLLMLPAGYGAYLLRQQGSIVLSSEGGSTGSPFENPLLFLVPALGAWALTLFVLRLLPLVMKLFAWIAGKTSSVGFLLATRYLSRDPGFYTAPLVLLILTLSLSSFTASLAQTLDNHLFDQSYYKVGADVHLVEPGQDTQASATSKGELGGGAAASTGATTTTASAEPTPTGPRWVFVPVGEHLMVPEVQAATRVGNYTASMQVHGKWKESQFIGIDRVDFPKAAYWRRDFAPANLGALMNALAVSPNGLLLKRDFMAQNNIHVGDTVQVRISAYGARVETVMKVAGELDYFPTWYPDPDKPWPLMVGNLDFVFEQAGGEIPYDVWARTESGIDYAKMVSDLRSQELVVLDYDAATLRIAKEQRRPERQGLFGVLSVGFLAAAFLAVLGFLLYALFSFRRRFIELGTLRAIGLSTFQMTAFLAWELAFLILLSLVAGTIIGAIISQAFIPYLQIGADVSAKYPPFQVQIAWPAIMRIYALFGALFVVALSTLAWYLMRTKIFHAIKLGETV